MVHRTAQREGIEHRAEQTDQSMHLRTRVQGVFQQGGDDMRVVGNRVDTQNLLKS
jgi:hypothetical protein